MERNAPAASHEAMRTAELSTGNTVAVESSPGAQPLVVFEAGMGLSSAMWGGVVTRLDDLAWLMYDRSGLGCSPSTKKPRRLADLADDLGALIEWSRAERVVLVGHSWGGLVTRVVAARHPARVVGVVLVDPTDEWGERVRADHTPTLVKVLRQAGAVGAWLAATLRVAKLASGWLARHLPEPYRARFATHDFSRMSVRALSREYADADLDLAALRDEPPAIGDIPLVIISGTRGHDTKRHTPPYTESHRVRARQHQRGRHVDATESGHMVPLTQPELIETEIRRLLAEL